MKATRRSSNPFTPSLTRIVLGGSTVAILVTLTIPSVYIVIWSIWGTATVGALGEPGNSWYQAVLRNRDWWHALSYSIAIAVASSGGAVLSSLLFFYYSIWHDRKYRSFGYALLIGPLLFPTLVYGLALRITFGSGPFAEIVALTLGHSILLFPIIYFLIDSCNESLKKEWVIGAASLGATDREILQHIVFPILQRPIITAFGIGTLFSFDEIVIASTVIDSARATVPKRMWDVINRDMDPTPAVIASLLLISTILISMAFHRIHSPFGEPGRGPGRTGRLIKKFFKNELLGELVADLLGVVIFRAVLLIWFKLPSLTLVGLVEEFALDALILICTTILTLGRKLWALKDSVSVLLSIYGQLSRRMRGLVLGIMSRKLENLIDPFTSALTKDGAVLTLLDVDLMSQLCFRSGKGVYHGTDSNPPSVFKRKYPQFLAYHEENIRKKNKPGLRILVCTKDKLVEDFTTDQLDFHEFWSWHLANNIQLLQVDPTAAIMLATAHSLPSTDIGIWDHEIAAIFTDLREENGLRLLLRPRGTELFDHCQDYFLALINRATKINLRTHHVEFEELNSTDRQSTTGGVREQWEI